MGAGLGLGLVLAFADASAALAQQARPPCSTSDCCSRAEGARLEGTIQARGEGITLTHARVEFRFTHPPEADTARTLSLLAAADTAGRFRACGIPVPSRVEAVAWAEGHASRTVSFVLRSPDRMTVDFTVEPVTTAEGVADSLQAARDAGRTVAGAGDLGGIAGRVLSADDGDPIGQVTVNLLGEGRQAVTRASGRFRFDSVARGPQTLRVRHLGYESRDIDAEVPSGQILGLTVSLDPDPVELEGLDVEVTSELRIPRLDRRGYYYRRALGFGEFLDPEYLTKWSGTRLADLVARQPGFQVRGRSRGREPIVVNASKKCTPAVIVDGQKQGPSVFASPSTEIAAVEIYSGPSETAGTLYTGTGCGLILVWTWHGTNPYNQ